MWPPPSDSSPPALAEAGAGVRAGVHMNTKMYMLPSKRDWSMPQMAITGSRRISVMPFCRPCTSTRLANVSSTFLGSTDGGASALFSPPPSTSAEVAGSTPSLP